jgi:hypothetical protein
MKVKERLALSNLKSGAGAPTFALPCASVLEAYHKHAVASWQGFTGEWAAIKEGQVRHNTLL